MLIPTKDSMPLYSPKHKVKYDITFWQRIKLFFSRPELSEASFELVEKISDKKGIFKINKLK